MRIQELKPHDTIVLDGITYELQPRIRPKSLLYRATGAKGTIYKLRTNSGELYALKILHEGFRVPEIEKSAEVLQRFLHLPGLETCKRQVFTPRFHAAEIDQYPELEYTVLMPWITGTTWREYFIDATQQHVQQRVQIPIPDAAQCLTLARTMARILAHIEAMNAAHTDIAGSNVIITSNGYSDPIQLVDIEEMFGPDMPVPVTKSVGTIGYQHPKSYKQSQWHAEGDRFAGAVIIAEMLCWYHPDVRSQAGDSAYFAPFEPANKEPNNPKYQVLSRVLHTEFEDVAVLFENAWKSATFSDCPTLWDWADTLGVPDEMSLPDGSKAALSTGEILGGIKRRQIDTRAPNIDVSSLTPNLSSRIPLDSVEAIALQQEIHPSNIHLTIEGDIEGDVMIAGRDASLLHPDVRVPEDITKDPVMFSALYPHEVNYDTEYVFLVYAHKPELLIQILEDAEDFKRLLGGEVPAPDIARRIATLKRDTPVTVRLECENHAFSPTIVTKQWRGEWLRFLYNFKISNEKPQVPSVMEVDVVVTVAGIEIARIPKCTISLKSRVEKVIEPVEISDKTPDNPLARAKLRRMKAKAVAMYSRIFVSYSRKDKVVAENYRKAQIARGDEVFMDTHSIRAGDDWEAALAEAIDEADFLQLFWSAHSAASQSVRVEWQYAIQFRCKDDQCVNFIRPVYWEEPLPDPPEELAHLNFVYVPL